MKNFSFPSFGEGERHTKATAHPSPRPLILRFVAWCMVVVWRTGVDWHAKRPFLTRITAHLSIIALTLIAIGLSGIGLPTPQAAIGTSSDVRASSLKMSASTNSGPTPSPSPTLPANQFHASDTDIVARLPLLHTNIPDRLRAEVITYAVQAGDTIFDVADRFGLSPETVVWSNREVLQDAPWLIQLGLELFILPVNGTYHVVRADDTAASIAAEYDVELAALYNEWNDLEEEGSLYEGQMLVVPGGQGDEVTWTPPQPEYATSGSAQYSYGVCSGATFTGPGANGWFTLPTGSPRVSGWYFHDVRNPTHIGLDYACSLGDPLYAADNGVVTIAGWNGNYGILVEVNHGNGFITRYAHFTDIIVGCGQPVYQGQLLGYCGSTGWSSGAHLHFEIRYNGIPQDPQAYLP
jgi:murein DD-endopeptidase MepM/ murein hydrolase activator NlpD